MMLHKYQSTTFTHDGRRLEREETISGEDVAGRWGYNPGNRASFLELINRWNATALRASDATNPPRHVYIALESV